MRRDAAIRAATRVAILKLGDDDKAEASHVLTCRDCFEIIANISRREFHRLTGTPKPDEVSLQRCRGEDAEFFARFGFEGPRHP